MPTYNPDASLTDNLKANGYTHAPAPTGWPGQRHVLDASGAVVFTGRYAEVAAWLRERIAEQESP